MATRKKTSATPKVDQTVYPLPQSEQPHPVFGFDLPPEESPLMAARKDV